MVAWQHGVSSGRHVTGRSRAHRAAAAALLPCLLRFRRASVAGRRARGPRLQDGRRRAAYAHRHEFRRRARPAMVPAARARTGWSIDLPDTGFVLDPKELKPRGLVAGVRYGNLGERHFAADPDRQGAVHRRALRGPAQRGRRRLPADRRPVGGVRQGIRRGAGDPGRNDRLDAPRRKGDRRRQAGAARRAASPSSSIPAMAASTAAPRGLSGTVEKDVTLHFATRTARPARARTAATRSS